MNISKRTYKGECTGEVLPYDLVKKAMADELAYFNTTVWESVEHDKAKHAPNFKLIRTRRAVCNTGDLVEPDVRARLAACEINDHKSDAFFVGTLPLEATKRLFFLLSSKRFAANGRPLESSVVEMKKTYFNAVPVRDPHLQFPRKLGAPKGHIGFRKRCVYGTRDAGLLWEDTYAFLPRVPKLHPWHGEPVPLPPQQQGCHGCGAWS